MPWGDLNLGGQWHHTLDLKNKVSLLSLTSISRGVPEKHGGRPSQCLDQQLAPDSGLADEGELTVCSGRLEHVGNKPCTDRRSGLFRRQQTIVIWSRPRVFEPCPSCPGGRTGNWDCSGQYMAFDVVASEAALT